jgi:hypothetical protein
MAEHPASAAAEDQEPWQEKSSRTPCFAARPSPLVLASCLSSAAIAPKKKKTGAPKQ